MCQPVFLFLPGNIRLQNQHQRASPKGIFPSRHSRYFQPGVEVFPTMHLFQITPEVVLSKDSGTGGQLVHHIAKGMFPLSYIPS